LKQFNLITKEDLKFINKVYNLDLDSLPRKNREHLICGVYFLWRGDLLVYVGQSKDVNSRIAFHYKDKKKFDTYSILEIPSKELNPTERILINKFLPQYNNDSLTTKLKDETFQH